MTDLTDLDLAGAADLLHAAAEKLGEVAHTDLPDMEPDHALIVLDRIRSAVWHVGTVTDALVRHIYEHGPRGHQVVDGVGAVYVGRSDSRPRWDDAGALQMVLDAKLAEYCPEHGGELPSPETVIRWVLEVASIGYFRKTQLRALGVPIDEVYESLPGRPTVTTPPRRGE